MVLRDNLFEYHDPWGAIGIILGLEEGHMDTTEMKISESSSADARSEILLDQSKAPEDAFCEQSQHFYGHHSSNSAPSSPLKNDGRAVFSYLDEREHHELGSPVASANPALQSKSDSDDEDIPFGDAHIHDASIYKPDDSRRNATPTNQSAPQPDFESKHFANESTPASPLLSFHAQVEPLVHSRRPFNQPYPTTPTKTTLSFFPHEAEPLADSNYDHGLNQSNPTTPNTDIEPLRSSRRIPKHCLNSLSTTSPSTHFDPRHESTPNISVSSHLDDFRAESEISPRAPGSFPPSITGKFQKFPKFPLPPIALHRPAAYNSTYIRPAPPIHSSRGSSNSSPPLPSQIQGSTSSPLVPLIRTAARTLPYIRASPPVHSPRGSSKSSPPPPSPQLRGSTPSPLIPLNRITARTFPYIVPMSPVHSPRGSSKSSPRAQSHQPTGTPSRSRFSLFNRPRDQAELPRSAEIDTEPIFKLGRPTDIQDTRRAALVRDEEKETIESEGCAPQRFFGDLCLFADDIDAPDSDE
ncbi:hypothetical protein K438DRAFT_1815623 [Mycena galopus ATCC 62051]|nr:hypothetical protein K438DRAFT_1815623 [Mycena galopus ATCC 62051]